MMSSRLAKAKLKTQTKEWHKYLENKILLVGNVLGAYKLINFSGNFNKLCEIIWMNETEHKFDSLEIFQQQVALGNYNFWMDLKEIEIIEEL